MAKSKGKGTLINKIGIAFGIFALLGMITMFATMGNSSSSTGMLIYGIVLGVVAGYLLFRNIKSLLQKRKENASSSSGSGSSSRPSSSSRPKPSSGSSSSSKKNIDFINAIQRGRYCDEFVSNKYGSAELYVPVDYEDDTYYIKPEIEISYNKYTCKTQADVDSFDDTVVAAYERQFKEMVRIADDWGVSYDIKEPSITTNIHNGEIL